MAEASRRVVLYSYLTGEPEAVAEFRWVQDEGVTLTVLDPGAEHLARQYYDRGAPLDAEKRSVPRSEGLEFMRALVQPSRATYFRFVDESDPDDD